MANAWPEFVIDDIVGFAVPHRNGTDRPAATASRVLIELALVAPRWARAIALSETLPPLVSRHCWPDLRLPRRLDQFMTWAELRTRVVAARRDLRPLPMRALLPIEECARGDCPRFCDRLELVYMQ